MADDKDYEEIRQAVQQMDQIQRRVKTLMAKVGMSRGGVFEVRGRLISDTMGLRPDLSQAEATTLVDVAIGLEPKN